MILQLQNNKQIRLFRLSTQRRHTSSDLLDRTSVPTFFLCPPSASSQSSAHLLVKTRCKHPFANLTIHLYPPRPQLVSQAMPIDRKQPSYTKVDISVRSRSASILMTMENYSRCFARSCPNSSSSRLVASAVGCLDCCKLELLTSR